MTKFRKNIIVQLEGWLEVSGVPIWNRSKSWFIWITMLFTDWRVCPYAGCHPKAALEKLDLIVQAAIRRRAKLPECFPNTLLAEKKYGVSKFSKSIPAQRNNLPEDEWLQDSSAQCYSQHSSRKVQGWGLDFLIWAQKIDFQRKVWTPDLDYKKRSSRPTTYCSMGNRHSVANSAAWHLRAP